jgi:hypothetical protein
VRIGHASRFTLSRKHERVVIIQIKQNYDSQSLLEL